MDTLFLVLSLFIPRITLIIFYLTGSIPYNNVPFVGDILLTVFIPRVLVLIYIVDNLGTGSHWFWIHLVVAVLVYISGNHYRIRRKRRKS